LTIRWPESVSALEPVLIEVSLVPPPGIEARTALTAVIRHSRAGLVYTAPLLPAGEHVFNARELFLLPLKPPPGTYRLVILVDSTLSSAGDRVVYFRPEPIPFHDLAEGRAGGVHEGASIAIPLAWPQAVAEGGPWAGKRIWQYPDGEVALWWAPGPTEALLVSNATVMLEATYDSDSSPQVVSVTETEWLGQTAYLFHEQWSGVRGGPAEALVVQGPDYWLYVVRIRARGGSAIPRLLRLVRDTFSFVE
jgi:hypothetical protein